MAIFGIDYAWGGPPSIAAMRAAGVQFVCRYLSHSPSKNLTAVEARRLSDAGIWIVVVWETTAQRALAGRTAGLADAMDAQMQAEVCGMPIGRPIFFAVDWGASSAQQDAINAYLDGAASALGRGRVGIYGGYGPVHRALDAGKAQWAWQTYAWSGGRWDSRAQLQQYSNDHALDGVDCDYDRATTSDYGQWRIGAVPQPQEEDDMISGQLHFGEDGKAPIGWPAGKFGAIGFWCDNGYASTDGKVKATDPCKLRVAVRHNDGTWQTEHITVGNAPGAASQKAVIHLKRPDKANGCSITREDGSINSIAFDAS